LEHPADEYSSLRLIRIGHKGADAIRQGNTLPSFVAAAMAGAEVIELDVLRPESDFGRGVDWRRAPAGPATATGPLLVAHDWGDARRREPLTLTEALDALARPPLAQVTIDLDLKLAGREDEIVAAVRQHDLLGRTMVSTMEAQSLAYLRDHEPSLRLGWTLPKVRRDWTRSRWGRPVVLAGSASLRARLPGMIRRHAPKLGVWAVWVYNPLITRRVVDSAHAAGVRVIAWTVDDLDRMRALAALGVDGICSNDPRLLAALERE
jgi:glycerophosphoryl diester phosphodiesterase